MMVIKPAETDSRHRDASTDSVDPVGGVGETGTPRATEGSVKKAFETTETVSVTEQTVAGVARTVEELNGATGG